MDQFRIVFLLRSVYDTLPSLAYLQWGLTEYPECKQIHNLNAAIVLLEKMTGRENYTVVYLYNENMILILMGRL